MCPISGGNWNNGSNAGVWTLNLNNTRANSNVNVGFRVADYEPPSKTERLQWNHRGVASCSGILCLTKSHKPPFFGSAFARNPAGCFYG